MFLCVGRFRYLCGVERILWVVHDNTMGGMMRSLGRCVCLVGYGSAHAQ